MKIPQSLPFLEMVCWQNVDVKHFAPALFGNSIAPATVIAEQDCQILTVERTALLKMIGNTPELALQIIAVLNERLQHLHQVVHGLASERAIVRLAQFIY